MKKEYLFAIDRFEARARGRRRRRATWRRRQRSSTLSFSSVAHLSFPVLLLLFFFFCSMSVSEGLCCCNANPNEKCSMIQRHSSIQYPSLFGFGPRIYILLFFSISIISNFTPMIFKMIILSFIKVIFEYVNKFFDIFRI